jgi:hypothetical protein
MQVEILESKPLGHCISPKERVIMMKKTTIAALGALGFFLTGCNWPGIWGNGHVVTKNRQVADFSELRADGAFDIEWRSGPPALSITTDENIMPHITSRTTDHQLRLHWREDLHPTGIVKVVVTSPTRSAVELTGACRLTASQLTGTRFALETRGAAKVTLDGNVNELLADMAGASKLIADRLQTKVAQISTAGAGKAEVAVSDTLKVSIAGAGKVIYTGNPPTIEKHISGAGVVERRE